MLSSIPFEIPPFPSNTLNIISLATFETAVLEAFCGRLYIQLDVLVALVP